MPRLLQPLWMVILQYSEKQLAQIIEYLREENKILRGKLPKRITLTDREKARLVQYGKKLGSGIRSVVTIVSPRTFLRWVKNETDAGSKKEPNRKPGRPKTDIEVRDLILKIARETGWGFTRILGELKKLGVRVSRTTVLNILTEAGIDPGPKRCEGTWSDYLERHTKPCGRVTSTRSKR